MGMPTRPAARIDSLTSSMSSSPPGRPRIARRKSCSMTLPSFRPARSTVSFIRCRSASFHGGAGSLRPRLHDASFRRVGRRRRTAGRDVVDAEIGDEREVLVGQLTDRHRDLDAAGQRLRVRGPLARGGGEGETGAGGGEELTPRERLCHGAGCYHRQRRPPAGSRAISPRRQTRDEGVDLAQHVGLARHPEVVRRTGQIDEPGIRDAALDVGLPAIEDRLRRLAEGDDDGALLVVARLRLLRLEVREIEVDRVRDGEDRDLDLRIVARWTAGADGARHPVR